MTECGNFLGLYAVFASIGVFLLGLSVVAVLFFLATRYAIGLVYEQWRGAVSWYYVAQAVDEWKERNPDKSAQFKDQS